MFISYEKLSNLKVLKNFKDKLFDLKVKQNLDYIDKNVLKVTKKLKKKAEKQKLNVVFYVYDESKWKCQSLYDLLIKDKHFNVKILATKNSAQGEKNPSYQEPPCVNKVYEYFKNKGMFVEYAYDVVNEKFIPLKKFNPDIIIYQHPWYVETSQGPVVCSKFALTYYVPYFVANAGLKEDYYLRFHKYVHKHYLLNKSLVEYFSSKMENNGKNIVAVGHPQLDYFYFNKNENNSKNCVIYAPHWSICKTGLAYGTFEWNGKYILEFAKSHPEINWIFKPHPLLKKSLVDTEFMDDVKVQKYYDEWANLGLKCEDSDYLKLFADSSAMITDCGSFLTEYFLTKKPLIHIVSGYSQEFCPHCKEIIKNYYEVKNIEELTNVLNSVIIEKNDTMKEIRENAVEHSDLNNNYAAENILNDIKKELNIGD